MAVKSNRNLRRTSMIALAVAALSLPGLAQAAPEGGRSWNDGRTARSESGPSWQPRQAPPPQQQTQQAPPPQAQRRW